jgi:hypothetical protein
MIENIITIAIGFAFQLLLSYFLLIRKVDEINYRITVLEKYDHNQVGQDIAVIKQQLNSIEESMTKLENIIQKK